MTVTEAPPTTPAGAVTARAAPRRGAGALLGTGDHLTVGRLFLGGAALFLVVGVVVGALLGVEAVSVDDLDIIGTDHVIQFFTMYRVTLVFLVVLPLFLGLAIAIVPRQLGAATVAFPRAAAAAFWAWFLGSVLLLVAYGIDGGPGGTDADAVDLWIVAFGLVVVALLLASVCVATTVVACRAPRMRLSQVPPFSWAMLVAAAVWLLSLPALVVNIVLAYLDHRYGQVLFGVPGDGDFFNRMAWVFDQPQVYAMAIPVLGVVAEMVPVAAGSVQRLRGVLYAGIAGFGVLAIGSWAQPALRADLVEDALYVGVAFAIVLPLLIVAGGLGDSAGRGTPRVVGPLLPATLGFLLLLAATVAGAVGTIDAFDLVGTSWHTGVMNLVFGASLLGALGGLLWWSPPLWGRLPSATVGTVAALAIGGGAFVVGVAAGIAGLLDQPAFPFAAFDVRDGVDVANAIGAVGAVLLALGGLVVTLSVLRGAAGRGDDEHADPWGGQTLEWLDGPVPEVTSATPLVATEERVDR